MTSNAVALRLDDVGASSKRYEVYARALPLPGRVAHVGDLLFFKFLPPLRAWGPYRELQADEWKRILEILDREGARMTVAVTAAWVTWSGDLIPFPERFPAQARVISEAESAGLLEVADHGLTHCVTDGAAFRPRLFTGNRREHREFWAHVPEAVHRDHLSRAQRILEGWLGRPVITFVPPGNVFTDATLAAAREAGIRVVSCETPPRPGTEPAVIGNGRVRAFHDRDLVLGGIKRLRAIVRDERERGHRFVFVRDLAGPE
ncbi:MAG: polysaccharide deacetylase family protein [Elusimicrobia bacterium]|nr:polysaccharide deacetylase family protein [Elusimicrobiota bacterium]